MRFNSVNNYYLSYVQSRRTSHKKQKDVCTKKLTQNIRGDQTCFQFKAQAFNKVAFMILTPVFNVCCGVEYVYRNTCLSNNSCIFSRNTIMWDVNILVRNSGV